MTSTLADLVMSKSNLLDEALLSNSLSGFVAGGIPGAWFSGMAFVEGLRVYHDMPENTSVALRLYLTSLILLALVATVIFAVVLYHHIISNFGRYAAADMVYPWIRYHFVICRLSVAINHLHFMNTQWRGLAIHRRSVAFVVALVGIITSLFLGSFGLSISAAHDLFKSNSYYALRDRGSLWRAMFLTEFLCDLSMLIIQVDSMIRSKQFDKVISSFAVDPLRTITSFLLMGTKTPIYNTLFALISIAVVGSMPFGTRYALVFWGSQIALWIVFSASTCSPEKIPDVLANSSFDQKQIGFPTALLEYNQRMHHSKFDEQRTVRTRGVSEKPTTPMHSEDEDEPTISISISKRKQENVSTSMRQISEEGRSCPRFDDVHAL